MTLPANRAFISYQHMRDERGIGFTGCTEGWFNCTFHAYLPAEVYRAAEACRAVDEVYADAGIDWPSSSPSNM